MRWDGLERGACLFKKIYFSTIRLFKHMQVLFCLKNKINIKTEDNIFI